MAKKISAHPAHHFQGQREEWQQFVESLELPVELMLGMGLETSTARLNRDITRFFNTIQRDALGTRWRRKPASERVTAVGFHEHMASNTHVHLAVGGGERVLNRLATNGLDTWKSIRVAGDFNFDRIHSLGRYSRYITKELYGRAALEAVYVYSPD